MSDVKDLRDEILGTKFHSSNAELTNKQLICDRLIASNIPPEELLDNLCLYTTRQHLSHILFWERIYRDILEVQGVIMEFGSRWGRNLSLLSNFRSIYEPFNYGRKIIGFDTFKGFQACSELDGSDAKDGDYNVAEGWQDELGQILELHQNNAPLPHKNKFELMQGDASETLNNYLDLHPETIISLAIFDFDIYEPTKNCLEQILPFVTKGSILVFDELNCPGWAGETLALKEILGLSKFAIKRDSRVPLASWLVIE